MKITFIMATGFTLTGGDRVISIYADRLQKRGHTVVVVSKPLPPPSVRNQIRSLLKGKGWQSKKVDRHLQDATFRHVMLESSRPVVDADVPDADVVIATWWETAEWVAVLSESKGAKAYFIQHHEVFDYLPQERARATYSLPLHKITISKWLVDLMESEYGDRTVSYVPNSVDTQQFYASPRGRQITPTVGMLYNTAPWKGCDISLRAFAIAAQAIPNLRLVALGAEEPLPQLPLPLGTEYFLRPPQHQIREIYARCDAWLFASQVEGFGLPILEAMACRTPVIGTPAGAAPELLSSGAGILVNPSDPEDMSRAIQQIYQLSEAEWQKMSDVAFEKATVYSWDDATDRFESALHTAIERKKQKTF